VGDAVPDAARAEIEAMASNPRGPRFAWLRGAVSPEALRAVVGPVVQEVLVQFAKNLPIAGKAAASASGAGSGSGSVARGLVGRLSRSTEALVNVGKSVADGLGVDLQAKLQDAARDYSQGATAIGQTGHHHSKCRDAITPNHGVVRGIDGAVQPLIDIKRVTRRNHHVGDTPEFTGTIARLANHTCEPAIPVENGYSGSAGPRHEVPIAPRIADDEWRIVNCASSRCGFHQ
jgi:hypothetical protein